MNEPHLAHAPKNVSTSESHFRPSPHAQLRLTDNLPPVTLSLVARSHTSSLIPSATMADHDDLHAEPTEGFKVGEKKTIDEYQQLGTCLLFRVLPIPHLFPSLQLAFFYNIAS